MNNAVYDKTMAKLRNRIDVKPIRNNFWSHKIFHNHLVAILKSKVILTVNKPAYIRMCILELSKVLMYEFHYDYIKKRFDNN